MTSLEVLRQGNQPQSGRIGCGDPGWCRQLSGQQAPVYAAALARTNDDLHEDCR